MLRLALSIFELDFASSSSSCWVFAVSCRCRDEISASFSASARLWSAARCSSCARFMAEPPPPSATCKNVVSSRTCARKRVLLRKMKNALLMRAQETMHNRGQSLQEQTVLCPAPHRNIPSDCPEPPRRPSGRTQIFARTTGRYFSSPQQRPMRNSQRNDINFHTFTKIPSQILLQYNRNKPCLFWPPTCASSISWRCLSPRTSPSCPERVLLRSDSKVSFSSSTDCNFASSTRLAVCSSRSWPISRFFSANSIVFCSSSRRNCVSFCSNASIFRRSKGASTCSLRALRASVARSNANENVLGG